MINNVLITGTSGGFGKYLHESLGGIGLTRENKDILLTDLKSEGAEVIIHCAYPRKLSDQNSLGTYIRDTIIFTNEVLKIPHRQFIFTSTIDVYPQNNQVHKEEEQINPSGIAGSYELTKLISEKIVELDKTSLILRLGGLIGKYTGKNNLVRLIEDESPVLSLTSDSTINCISYSDILDFISLASARNIFGIYNVCSSSSVSMVDLARILGKRPQYGKFNYSAQSVDNSKAISVLPSLKKTSEKAVLEYISAKPSKNL